MDESLPPLPSSVQDINSGHSPSVDPVSATPPLLRLPIDLHPLILTHLPRRSRSALALTHSAFTATSQTSLFHSIVLTLLCHHETTVPVHSRENSCYPSALRRAYLDLERLQCSPRRVLHLVRILKIDNSILSSGSARIDSYMAPGIISAATNLGIEVSRLTNEQKCSYARDGLYGQEGQGLIVLVPFFPALHALTIPCQLGLWRAEREMDMLAKRVDGLMRLQFGHPPASEPEPTHQTGTTPVWAGNARLAEELTSYETRFTALFRACPLLRRLGMYTDHTWAWGERQPKWREWAQREPREMRFRAIGEAVEEWATRGKQEEGGQKLREVTFRDQGGMVEMDVHRCRFVPFPPSPINALAFSHSSDPKAATPLDLRLAIGRANGNIEIWNPLDGIWVHESTFWGGRDRVIDSLVWTQDPPLQLEDGKEVPGQLRLFSTGQSTAVTEWDLAQGAPLRHESANHGALWCMAAQPSLSPSQKSDHKKRLTNGTSASKEKDVAAPFLAVGCDDGSIVLLSTANENLTYHTTLSKSASKKSRVLCVTFQNHHRLAAGCADGKIQIFDIRSNTLLRTIALGSPGVRGASKQTLVWAIKVLPKGDLVSGDSNGEVRWYDAKNYGQLQRLKTHRADVISLEVSADGETVFSGSMDRRTAVFKITKGGALGQKWAEALHRRFHRHDVKALAVFESRTLKTLVSGGVDATPIVVPIRQLGTHLHRNLPALPQQSPTCSCPAQRLLVSWWDQEIRLWRILSSDGDPRENQRMVARIGIKVHLTQSELIVMTKFGYLLQGEEKISDVSISADGRLLAVASLSEIKIFRIRHGQDPFDSLRLKKLDLPTALQKSGARHLSFSPDTHWLCIVNRFNEIHVNRITREAEGASGFSPDLKQVKRPENRRRKQVEKSSSGALGAYERKITHIAFSAQSNILAVANLSGCIDSWLLQIPENGGKKTNGAKAGSAHGSDSEASSEVSDSDSEHPLNSTQERWRPNPALPLPLLPSAPLILSFRPTSQPTLPSAQTEDRLLLLTATHTLHEFALLTGQPTDWSLRNPSALLPSSFTRLKDRATSCVWDVSPIGDNDSTSFGHRVWFCGSSWLGAFDLSADLPLDRGGEESDGASQEVERKGKRKAVTNGDVGTGGEDSTPAVASQSVKRKRRKTKNDGAGDEIPFRSRETGKLESDSASRQLSNPQNPNPEDSDAEDETTALSLAQHHRANTSSFQTLIDPSKQQKNAFKPIFRYRSILGMVPISVPGAACEVVVVERPVVEAELPDRFEGGQEWSGR
ncbi:MAG: U3 small nucleolar RNA-associated protein [Vezdaea aestivalis]|nr:MAG: U3 small nucleolar RNA-associated protein [Vezdaea aestivalis]